MLTAGIDLSLTSTGIALLDTAPTEEWDLTPRWTVDKVTSTGHDSDDWRIRLDRILRIAREIENRIPAGADAVAIEGPSIGSRHQQHMLGGLWWTVVDNLDMILAAPLIVVPPHNLRKYAAGKAGPKVTKVTVGIAAARLYPDAPIDGDDQADAVVLAAMAARIYGSPIEPRELKQFSEALEGVHL